MTFCSISIVAESCNIARNVDGVGKATLAQAWKSYINYHPGKQLLAVATQLGDVNTEEQIVKYRLPNIKQEEN